MPCSTIAVTASYTGKQVCIPPSTIWPSFPLFVALYWCWPVHAVYRHAQATHCTRECTQYQQLKQTKPHSDYLPAKQKPNKKNKQNQFNTMTRSYNLSFKMKPHSTQNTASLDISANTDTWRCVCVLTLKKFKHSNTQSVVSNAPFLLKAPHTRATHVQVKTPINNVCFQMAVSIIWQQKHRHQFLLKFSTKRLHPVK